MKVRLCELCNADASVYCPSDAAFLCRLCDGKVHEANFLVARHVRQSICSNCRNLTGHGSSGVGFRAVVANCASCPPAEDDDGGDGDLDSLSSGSSVCISSTTTRTKENSGGCSSATSGKRRRPCRSAADPFKAEVVFVSWCGKIGVEADLAVRMACKALKVCLDRWTVLPFRVCLAASMWLGLRLSLDTSALTAKALKRLEEASGVPAKIILAAESKLERALRGGHGHRRRLELEEGWAESQV